MTSSAKTTSGRTRLGLRPGEKAASKLDQLDFVIAELQKAHDEYVRTVKAGLNHNQKCSVELLGYDASYLLRSLKGVRNRDADPFGIDGAFRANRGPSVPEQANLAREVRAEIEAGRATSDTEALQRVSERRHIGFEKLKTIYYDLKDFI